MCRTSSGSAVLQTVLPDPQSGFYKGPVNDCRALGNSNPPFRGLVTVTTSRLIPGLFGLAEEERAAQEMTSFLGGKSLESWVGPPGRLRRAERKHLEKMTQSSSLSVQSCFVWRHVLNCERFVVHFTRYRPLPQSSWTFGLIWHQLFIRVSVLEDFCHSHTQTPSGSRHLTLKHFLKPQSNRLTKHTERLDAFSRTHTHTHTWSVHS